VARPAARLRLFCFAYAGGSATAFHRLAQWMPPSIETHSLQLPGRGFRIREPAVTSWPALLDAVQASIVARADRSYALLGHSMGALVAFETARRLRRAGKPAAVHLFASAAPAPRVTRALRVPTSLGANDFWTQVHQLYGTPTQAIADPELLKLVVPPLKADFELVASYRYAVEAPLSVPITVITGTKDPVVSIEDAEAWRGESTGAFSRKTIEGPHLYVNEAPGLAAVGAIVKTSLGV
jgi:surfactin synthase thioesterase subunit